MGFLTANLVFHSNTFFQLPQPRNKKTTQKKHHLLLQPAMAQFGIPMKKKGSSFQDLQDQAVASDGDGGLAGMMGGAGGDMGDLAKMFEGVDMEQMQELWKNALNDPETMKQMESMGAKMGEAMEELAKMTPEQMQQQMQEAMEMLTTGDMADSILEKKDEVLASLEASGMVSAEELAKFKADPAYFELKMRESFGQMKEVFSDPQMIKGAMDMMKGGGAGGADMMQEMAKAFSEGLDTDEKIEEARLEILSNPELSTNPMLKQMFAADEFKEVLYDADKWRESVKEGQKAFTQGAGVGEL